ncbi:hypothetical protein D1871_16040 [Nakamurella silvestris]|nr:hypothetical protein D1871_16040 [Nakamurella silvestris]
MSEHEERFKSDLRAAYPLRPGSEAHVQAVLAAARSEGQLGPDEDSTSAPSAGRRPSRLGKFSPPLLAAAVVAVVAMVAVGATALLSGDDTTPVSPPKGTSSPISPPETSLVGSSATTAAPQSTGSESEPAFGIPTLNADEQITQADVNGRWRMASVDVHDGAGPVDVESADCVAGFAKGMFTIDFPERFHTGKGAPFTISNATSNALNFGRFDLTPDNPRWPAGRAGELAFTVMSALAEPDGPVPVSLVGDTLTLDVTSAYIYPQATGGPPAGAPALRTAVFTRIAAGTPDPVTSDPTGTSPPESTATTSQAEMLFGRQDLEGRWRMSTVDLHNGAEPVAVKTAACDLRFTADIMRIAFASDGLAWRQANYALDNSGLVFVGFSGPQTADKSPQGVAGDTAMSAMSALSTSPPPVLVSFSAKGMTLEVTSPETSTAGGGSQRYTILFTRLGP